MAALAELAELDVPQSGLGTARKTQHRYCVLGELASALRTWRVGGWRNRNAAMLEPSDKGAWLTAGRVILEGLKWAVLPEKAAL